MTQPVQSKRLQTSDFSAKLVGTTEGRTSHLTEIDLQPVSANVTSAGGFIFLSDIGAAALAQCHSDDIKTQTRCVFQNIGQILRNKGGDLNDLVKITTFLLNMDDYRAYNQVYSEFFDYDGPVRTTVSVTEFPSPGVLIDVKAIAFLPTNQPGKTNR